MTLGLDAGLPLRSRKQVVGLLSNLRPPLFFIQRTADSKERKEKKKEKKRHWFCEQDEPLTNKTHGELTL